MTQFDIWLADRIAEINTIKTDISTNSTVLDAILPVQKEINKGVAEYKTAIKKINERDGLVFVTNENLRNSLHKLAENRHDAELTLTMNSFLTRNSIDLQRLFSPLDFHDIIVSQASPAILDVADNACAFLNNGYVMLTIPIRLTNKLIKQDFTCNLAIPLYLNLHNDVVSIKMSGLVQVCPDPGLGERNLTDLRREASSALERLLVTRSFAIPPLRVMDQTGRLYGARFSNRSVKIYALLGSNRRERLPLTGEVSPGFDLSVKASTSKLLSIFTDPIIGQGILIQSIQLMGAKSFKLELKYQVIDKVRVGCVDIPFRVSIEITAAIDLSVRGRSGLTFTIRRLSEPQVDVSMAGIPFPDILTANILNAFLSLISISLEGELAFTFDLGQRQMDAELKSRILILNLKY
ncbi:hypothetical protein [Dyadobacter sp. 22481]|uniref:hypothetical protein n=1 Tax=Dyadobacter sp. 22481 TaxID=3453926 RepID=UPI003F83E991